MPERILKYSEALKEALTIEMGRDESVILYGEDVARHCWASQTGCWVRGWG